MDNLGKRLNRHLQREIEGIRGELGKLQTDGTMLVPVSGAPNEVYVRLDGDPARTEAAINQRVNPRARLPVRLRRNSSGRYEVIGLDAIPANGFLGENAPSANIPVVEGAAVNALWESYQLKPGKIRALSDSGLGIFMEELAYGDTLLGNVSMNLATVAGTISASSKAWIIIAVDPATNTLSATKGTEVGYPIPLTRDDANAETVTSGLLKLWAFLMRSGDTSLPNQPRSPDTVYFADLRPWLTIPGDVGAVDATDVTYTPGDSGDWSATPDHVDEALDTLASDVAGLVAAGTTYPKRATMWHDEALVTNGNVIASDMGIAANQLYQAAAYQNTPANADAFTHSFMLRAGTYTFSVLGVVATNRGKIDWYIDDMGTPVITGQDWYDGTPAYNVIKTVSVTVTGDGYHKLKGVINGKNGSSSDYYMVLTRYSLIPSAD